MEKIIIILIIGIVVIEFLKNIERKTKKDDRTIENLRAIALATIKQKDTFFNEANFINWAKNQFLKMQIYYSDKNLEKLKTIESENLIKKHIKEIEDLKVKNKNIITTKILVNDAKLYSFESKNEKDILTIYINSSMINYVEIEQNSEIIEGSKKKRQNKEFLLTFVRPSVEVINGKIIVKCKGCGASNTILDSGRCEYCATKFATGDYDWLIEDIRDYEEKINQ